MTFKELRKRYSQQQESLTIEEEANPRLALLLQRLRNKPFWIWSSVEKHKQQHASTKGNCCFNHIIGLPKKDGIPMPMFDYEKIVCDALLKEDGNFKDRHIWIKKATGLGITEIFLRIILWFAIKDNAFNGKQVVIVTGPNWQIAISLIKRIKAIFLRHLITFSNKETVLYWLT